jgi:hypothetical protein
VRQIRITDLPAATVLLGAEDIPIVQNGVTVRATLAQIAAEQVGPQGPQGVQGIQGIPGEGVPVGGTTGEYLRKASGADRDTAWATFALVNADIDAAAAIAYSKLSLTGSVVNADIATGAAIGWGKVSKTGASVADIPDFPTQSGQSGKFLTTNGTALAWGSVGGGWTAAVTVVTANYTVLTSDNVIVVNKSTGSATTITLPASPTTGSMVIVKDGKGDAATNNITIQGNGKNIDGTATRAINVNYGAFSLAYNGTQWNVWAERAGAIVG